MGSITVPPGSRLYIDAHSIISSAERIDPYYDVLMPLWESLRDGSIEVLTSELSILETLILPARLNDEVMEIVFRNLLFHSSGFRLYPISQRVLERPVTLRAKFGLKTPDSIHAATALESESSHFISNDSAFRRVPELPVTLLSEKLEA